MFCGEPGCRQWAKTLEHGRSKELTLTIYEEKKKKWKTASLDRNIRSRKWKAYRFSIHDISGGKADSLWPGTGHLPVSLPFTPASPPPWIVVSGKAVLRSHIYILRTYLQKHQHNTFTCSHCIQKWEDPERLKMPVFPAFCLRRNSGTRSSYRKTKLWFAFFPVCTSSPLSQTPNISAPTWSMWAALTCPFQMHAEQILSPPTWTKGWMQLTDLPSSLHA